jgi:type IV secretion system protein VirB9
MIPLPTARLVAFAASLTLGCAASAPHPSSAAYVRAQPTPDPPPPAAQTVQVPPPVTLPGQFKRVPVPHVPASPADIATASGKGGPSRPLLAVQIANRDASATPDKDSYFNAILQYTYEPGSLYQVYCAPLRVTDLTLEPGEKIVGQPASGDVVRWVLALGKSVQNGVETQHVYIKPTRPDLETNLALNTDRRSYMLELHSFPDTYMAAVQWHYPHDEMARLEAAAGEAAAAARESAPVANLESLNFNYSIHVESGEPKWTPIQVFDDGRRTFIRFAADMLVREAPALFVLRDKETQLVNYRVKRDTYVVDRLIDAAELRVGQKDQEIVRIVRGGARQ